LAGVRLCKATSAPSASPAPTNSCKLLGRLLWYCRANVRRQLKVLARNPQTVVVYDNINFKDTKRDEVVGHKSHMCSMTTAAIILCPELPSSGLHQVMHNPTVPLRVHDIFSAPGISDDDSIGLDISRSLITDAIKRLHPSSVSRIFTDSDDSYPKMPRLQSIRADKTRFWQFGAIFEDEGTIDGTYGVHESIFLQQLGLQTPDDPNDTSDDFHDRLWLIHGDQLTVHRIRAVKAEQLRAKRSFDRRDWLLRVSAWFHIQMNLFNTIVRTHWAPARPKEEAHHRLKADIATWSRSYSSRDSVKYHQIEPLILQSFISRVAALFYAAMRLCGVKGILHPLTRWKEPLTSNRHSNI
jgi:hypothetical protein